MSLHESIERAVERIRQRQTRFGPVEVYFRPRIGEIRLDYELKDAAKTDDCLVGAYTAQGFDYHAFHADVMEVVRGFARNR